MVQQGFEYHVLIRVDGTLNHSFSQSPCRADQHGIGKTGFGVDRKHHPGARLVGANHDLHTDGKGDLHMVETIVLTIDDGPVGKQRGITASTGVKKCSVANDIEKTLLLPSEARIRQVFGSRTATNRDTDILAFASQPAIGLQNFLLDVGWEGGIGKQLANSPANRRKIALVRPERG